MGKSVFTSMRYGIKNIAAKLRDQWENDIYFKYSNINFFYLQSYKYNGVNTDTFFDNS